MTLETVSDHVRVYDVTDDGRSLRIERVRRREGDTISVSDTDVGVCDLAALGAFPDGVPVIDLEACDDGLTAFGRELVGE